MSQEAARTTSEILGSGSSRQVLTEIFSDLHPALREEAQEVRSVFTPQSAAAFLEQLTDITELFHSTDRHDEILDRLQAQIDEAEALQEELLREVFSQMRPIERSYRQLQLFFENCSASDYRFGRHPDVYIFNADSDVLGRSGDKTLQAVESFVRSRNDNLNFGDDIHILVVPGEFTQSFRDTVDVIALKWGLLLVCDVGDVKTLRDIERNLRPGGKFEFLKRSEDRSASSVIVAGYLRLRLGWAPPVRQTVKTLFTVR